MPRIRTIKPEFWSDTRLAPLEPVDRLVYLGLISMADDAGRLPDNVKTLDGLLFSASPHSVAGSLLTLARLGRILRYSSQSGDPLIQIVSWERHQKVTHRSVHVLPAPTDADFERAKTITLSREPQESLRIDSGESPESLTPILNPLIRSSVQPYNQKKDSPLESAKKVEGPPESLPKKPSRKRPLRGLPGGWTPNAQHRALALRLGLDCEAEAERWKDYLASSGALYADHDAAYRNNLRRRAEDRSRSNGNRTVGAPSAPARRLESNLTPEGDLEQARLDAEDRRIALWRAENPGDAYRIEREAAEEVLRDPQWTHAPQAIRVAVAKSKTRLAILAALGD